MAEVKIIEKIEEDLWGNIQSGYYKHVPETRIPYDQRNENGIRNRIKDDLKDSFTGTLTQIEAEVEKRVKKRLAEFKKSDKVYEDKKYELRDEFKEDLLEFCGYKPEDAKAVKLLNLVIEREDWSDLGAILHAFEHYSTILDEETSESK